MEHMTGPDLVVAGLPLLKDAQSGDFGPFLGCSGVAHRTLFLSFLGLRLRFYIRNWVYGAWLKARYNLN